MAEISVKHPSLGAQQFMLALNPRSHNFVDIPFNPVLPPEPTSTEPTEEIEEPPAPEPVRRPITVTIGKTTEVGEIRITDRPDTARASEPLPPPPPPEQIVEKVEILLPVDGSQFHDDGNGLSDDLSTIRAVVTKADFDPLSAEAYVNGEAFGFDPATDSSIAVHEGVHIVQMSVKKSTGEISDKALEAEGRISVTVSVPGAAGPNTVGAQGGVELKANVQRSVNPSSGQVERQLLPATTGAVTGMVVSDATGEPLAGMPVAIDAAGEGLSTYTNEHGHYSFPEVAPGASEVVVGTQNAEGAP